MTGDSNPQSTIHFLVETDGYEVIHSGTAILFKNNGNIIFHINDLCIELNFSENDNNEEPTAQIVQEKLTDKRLVLKCSGYKNPLGAGSKEPINLFRIKNDDIYFRYIAFGINNLPYIIYSFYRKVKHA